MNKIAEYANLKDKIIEELASSQNFCFGIVDSNGKILNRNEAFKTIFDIKRDGINIINNMVSPDFEVIKSFKGDSKIFDGIITISDGFKLSNSYNGKIFRDKDSYLFIAEYDTTETQNINSELNALNREITNLQRNLIKEKKTLQTTLDELRDTQQMLIHSEKMNGLGQLVAGVAHEINNPLTFICSNVFSMKNIFTDLTEAFFAAENIIKEKCPEALKEKDLRNDFDIDFITEDTPDLLDSSLDGLNRVKKIVENLRVFSRLDESEYKQTNLEENIKATVAIAQTELSDRNIDLNYFIEEIKDFYSYISELNQVILNMIINAAQAIGRDGLIIIKGYTEKENVIIEIIDNGKGIPEEVIGSIFNPFFTTKPVGEGTGLGLSIAYKMIKDKHKGKIDVESMLNHGTTFRITIPKRI